LVDEGHCQVKQCEWHNTFFRGFTLLFAGHGAQHSCFEIEGFPQVTWEICIGLLDRSESVDFVFGLEIVDVHLVAAGFKRIHLAEAIFRNQS
jgi:hypothetical protein